MKRWKAAPVEAAAQNLKSCVEGLQSQSDNLRRAFPSSWKGEASDAAAAKESKLRDHLDKKAVSIGAAKAAVEDASDSVSRLEVQVRSIEAQAVYSNLSICDDGTVSDACTDPPIFGNRGEADEYDRGRRQAVADCARAVAQAVKTAQSIDKTLQSHLKDDEADKLGDGGTTTLAAATEYGETHGGAAPSAPPQGDDVQANKKWWDNLTPSQQERVIDQHPDWIGNRDGVDFTSRDKANRKRLPGLRNEIDNQIAEKESDRSTLLNEGKKLGIPVDTQAIDQVLDHLKAKKKALDTLQGIANQPATADKHILGIDMNHSRVQAIVASGNVDLAKHVSVYTPGLTSNVGGIGGMDSEMNRLRRSAAQREVELRGGAPNENNFAAVTWLDYQAPQLSEESLLSNNNVGEDHAAKEGAPRLAKFYDAVRARDGARPDITALGHSYGSLVTGQALTHTHAPDRAVYFGSPGLGVEHMSQLAASNKSYLLTADYDAIAYSGRFSQDPENLAGMHGLSSGDAVSKAGQHLSGVTWHTNYLKPGSTSLYNISSIVADREDLDIAKRLDYQKPWYNKDHLPVSEKDIERGWSVYKKMGLPGVGVPPL